MSTYRSRTPCPRSPDPFHSARPIDRAAGQNHDYAPRPHRPSGSTMAVRPARRESWVAPHWSSQTMLKHRTMMKSRSMMKSWCCDPPQHPWLDSSPSLVLPQPVVDPDAPGRPSGLDPAVAVARRPDSHRHRHSRCGRGVAGSPADA